MTITDALSTASVTGALSHEELVQLIHENVTGPAKRIFLAHDAAQRQRLVDEYATAQTEIRRLRVENRIVWNAMLNQFHYNPGIITSMHPSFAARLLEKNREQELEPE